MSAVFPPSDRALLSVLEYFPRWLSFRRSFLRVPGIQAAVFAGGRTALSFADGVADVATGEQLRPDHMFRVASHSKTFTGTALLQLVERGALRLDDSAGHWLPSLVENGSPLADATIRELLCHSAGAIRDGKNADFWQQEGRFLDDAELREILLDADARTLPRNDRFKYSNIGFAVLGQIVAACVGATYNEHLMAAIIEPLGLHNTAPDLDPARLAQRATGHSALSYADHRVPLADLDTGALSPATGVVSTAEDLVSYFSAHFLGSGLLLSDESKRLMQIPVAQQPDGTRYGLGMGAYTVGTRLVRGHGGGFPGTITSSMFDREAGIAVSVLANAIDAPAYSMSAAFYRLLDAAEGSVASASAGAAFADIASYSGRFANLWGVRDLVPLGSSLFIIDPSASDPLEEALRLAPTETDGVFLIEDDGGSGKVGEVVRCIRGDGGALEAVVIAGSRSTAFDPQTPLSAIVRAVDLNSDSADSPITHSSRLVQSS